MTKDARVITLTYNDIDVIPSLALTEAIDACTDALEELDVSVARIPDRGAVDVTIYAPGELGILDAAEKYAGVVGRVVDAAPVGVEVVSEAVCKARAEAPTMPELMSAGEIADELGISRQRAY